MLLRKLHFNVYILEDSVSWLLFFPTWEEISCDFIGKSSKLLKYFLMQISKGIPSDVFNKQESCAPSLSHVCLFVTLGTVPCQAPLSLEFFKQEFWSGLPFPPPRDLPDPGIQPVSPDSSTLAGGFLTTLPPGKPQAGIILCN